MTKIRTIHIDREYQPPEWQKPVKKKKDYNWLYHTKRRAEKKNE